MNAQCVICSELLNGKSDLFATSCGHVFHQECLLKWMERASTCPQCRHKETLETIHKIFINIASSEGIADDVCTLQAKLDTVSFEILCKEKELAKYNDKLVHCKSKCKMMRDTIMELEGKARSHESSMLALKGQLRSYQAKFKEHEALQLKIDALKQKVEAMESTNKVSSSCYEQADEMLRHNNDIQSLTLLVTQLKRQLVETKRKHQSLTAHLTNFGKRFMETNTSISKLTKQNEELRNGLRGHEKCASKISKLVWKINKVKAAQGNATESSGSNSIIDLSSSTDESDIVFDVSDGSDEQLQLSNARAQPASVDLNSDDLSWIEHINRHRRPSSSNPTSSKVLAVGPPPQSTTTVGVKRTRPTTATSLTSANKFRKLAPAPGRKPT